jgi:hypothetical protein
VDRAAELGVGIDEALLAIDMVYVIGTTEDFVADAIASARAALTRFGARALLDALDTRARPRAVPGRRRRACGDAQAPGTHAGVNRLTSREQPFVRAPRVSSDSSPRGMRVA